MIDRPDDHDDDDLEEQLAAARRILARVAILLRQGKVEQALAEIPITEHERLAEQVLGDELPPRKRPA
jgi:hypothetical protein